MMLHPRTKSQKKKKSLPKKMPSDKLYSLSELFEAAESNGTVTSIQSMDDIGSEEFTKRNYPRPAGYAAQTILHFGGLCVPALLDSCATCSVMPEEVLCILLGHVFSCLDNGTLDATSPMYPVVALEAYRHSSTVVGVGIDDKMETRYGACLLYTSTRPRDLSTYRMTSAA